MPEQKRRSGATAVHSVNRVVFTVPKIEEAERFYRTFGLDVRREGERIDLYTFGHPHCWATIHANGKPKKLQYLSFGVFEEDLPHFRNYRSAAQLMILPERHFTPLLQIRPQVAEALLVPFSVKGELVGTVWVLAHDASRQFDREDQRVISNLTEFAATAYERLAVMDLEAVNELTRMRSSQRPD